MQTKKGLVYASIKESQEHAQAGLDALRIAGYEADQKAHKKTFNPAAQDETFSNPVEEIPVEPEKVAENAKEPVKPGEQPAAEPGQPGFLMPPPVETKPGKKKKGAKAAMASKAPKSKPGRKPGKSAKKKRGKK